MLHTGSIGRSDTMTAMNALADEEEIDSAKEKLVTELVSMIQSEVGAEPKP